MRAEGVSGVPPGVVLPAAVALLLLCNTEHNSRIQVNTPVMKSR